MIDVHLTRTLTCETELKAKSLNDEFDSGHKKVMVEFGNILDLMSRARRMNKKKF